MHSLVPNRLDERILYPHYSDERFWKEVLLFWDGEEGGCCEYQDRLISRDREAAERAREATRSRRDSQVTAAYWQEWLTAYYGKPVKLHKILGSTNTSGYPIWCFKFEFSEIAASLFHFHKEV